jgi:transposase
MIPLFHLTYQGNMNDGKVFQSVITRIKERLIALDFDLAGHTLVFDRGNNSKKILKLSRNLP